MRAAFIVCAVALAPPRTVRRMITQQRTARPRGSTQRSAHVAGLLDEGDITRAELSELFGRAPKALAADWQEVEDPSSGNPYYWNTRTSETTWERPIGDVIDAGGFVWLSAAIEDLFED